MKYKKFNIIQAKNNINNNFINKFFIKFEKKKLSNFSYKKNNLFYFILKIKNIDKLLLYKYKKLFKNIMFLFCGFSYAKVFLKVGLGFRKKFNRTHNMIQLNVVRRKIVLFKPSINSFFINVKRRNLYVFSSTKKKLFYYIVSFKGMRSETIYKFKGIFTNVRMRFFKRATKTILFARRVKFKKMKLKLTKKQKLKK